MQYEDFVIRVLADADGGLTVRVEDSPYGGSPDCPLEYPFEEREAGQLFELLDQVIMGYEWVLTDSSVEEMPFSARRVGERLFQALIQGPIRDCWLQSLARVQGYDGQGLRLRLVIDPSHPQLAPLSALPWEMLAPADGRGYLSLNRKTALVRFLEVPQLKSLPAVEMPVKVLLVATDPIGNLDLNEEQSQIMEVLEALPSVQVRCLEEPTIEQLRTELLRGRFHVLHFMGHGVFEKNEGILLFKDESGARENIRASVLASTLSGLDLLRLVVLNACDSAKMVRHAGSDPYAATASALVMAGIPAVIAMQVPFSDQAALAFSHRFYAALIAGDPVDAAVAEGRLAVLQARPTTFQWATPVLFMRVPDGKLFALEEGEHPIRKHILLQGDLIAEKTKGFVGREFVFNSIDKFTSRQNNGYFLIKGDPGIGKTSLMAEMVRRHRHLHHFNIRSMAAFRRTESFLVNLCAQIIVRFGLDRSSLPPEAGRDSGFLCSLLGQASPLLEKGAKLLLLVDALDEVERHGLMHGQNILDLPTILPEGVFFVLTTRPKELPLRFDCPHKVFEFDARSPTNLEDIRIFVRGHLEREGIRSYIQNRGIGLERFVEDLVERSEGNFMYLRHVLPEIELGAYRDRPLDEIPEGLENYYEEHWDRMRNVDRQAWFDYKLPVLAALTKVKQPVSLDFIAGILDKSDSEGRRKVLSVLVQWEQFLHVEPILADGQTHRLYRLYHGAFHDFIKRKDEIAEEHVQLSKMSLTIARYVRDRHQARKRKRGFRRGLRGKRPIN